MVFCRHPGPRLTGGFRIALEQEAIERVVSNKYGTREKVQTGRRPDLAVVEGASLFVPPEVTSRTPNPRGQAETLPTVAAPAHYKSRTCDRSYGILASQVTFIGCTTGIVFLEGPTKFLTMGHDLVVRLLTSSFHPAAYIYLLLLLVFPRFLADYDVSLSSRLHPLSFPPAPSHRLSELIEHVTTRKMMAPS